MCTTVIVGKLASKTGRVIVGHNEDAGGRCLHQQFFCPAQDHAPGEFVTAEPGTAKVPQAAHTLATYWSNMQAPVPGASFDQGFANEAGLVICSNGGGSSFDADDEKLGKNLLTEGGVGFLLRRLMAERASTAREAVLVAKHLIETYGYTGTARNYTIADKNEAWCINVVMGKHFVAKRIPDDKVMLISNMLAIRSVDLEDKENVIASEDLIDWAIEHGRYSPKTPGDYSDFDFARAYQSDENRHAPTKSVRMRLGWLEIANVYCADELHYPELMTPTAPMGVEEVKAVLRLTAPETYRERGDGRADAFHVSAVDISRSHTRESWVMELAETPLMNTLWRLASYQDTGVYIPWFPMAGVVPQGYQWTSLEEAHRVNFAMDNRYLSLDYAKSYYLYAVLGELVNFNRGLMAGVWPVREGLEAEFRADVEKIREDVAGLSEEAAKTRLGQFTAEEAAKADARYRELLATIDCLDAEVCPGEISIADEAAEVVVKVFATDDFDPAEVDPKSLLWSLGFTSSKPSVNEPAKPLRVTAAENALEVVFRAHDVSKFAVSGVICDTYIRGFMANRRFVAMAPALFKA